MIRRMAFAGFVVALVTVAALAAHSQASSTAGKAPSPASTMAAKAVEAKKATAWAELMSEKLALELNRAEVQAKIAAEAIDKVEWALKTKALVEEEWAEKAAFSYVAKVEAEAAAAAKVWAAQELPPKGYGFPKGIEGGIPGGVKGGVPGGVKGELAWAEQSPPGKGDPALTDDQELKLMAINSLRNTNSEEAIPLLEKVLKGSEPMKLKERALAVLAGFETSKARDVVAGIARSNADRDLQLRALRYLARFDGDATKQILAEIYKGSSDAEVKKIIIRSYHSMDDTAQLSTIARSDADADMRSYAIRHLGAQNAQKELRAIYDAEANADVKAQTLRALAACGDHQKLAEIAKNDKDAKLRREAIRQMSAVDSVQMGDTIVALYGSETDIEVRKEALRTLARQEDVKRLVAVARAEKDPVLKRYAVDRLAQMKSKEANDFLLELLNK